MKTKPTVRVNGETFEISLTGLRPGDSVKGVGEQCEGCGNALDADAFAILGRDRKTIACSECGTTYEVRS